MKRLASLVAALLLSHSALALTIEPWEHQQSLALGDATLIPTRFRVLDDGGQPVAGVAYAFIIDDTCATFPNGATGASGVTDAYGFASSPQVTATELASACEMIFAVDGVLPTVHVYTFVFSPEDVVLSSTPEAVSWFTSRSFKMSVEAKVNGVLVNAFPMNATPTVGTNGATGEVTGFLGLVNGASGLAFTTNDKQGRYEIVITYRAKSLAIPVEQRKKL